MEPLRQVPEAEAAPVDRIALTPGQKHTARQIEQQLLGLDAAIGEAQRRAQEIMDACRTQRAKLMTQRAQMCTGIVNEQLATGVAVGEGQWAIDGDHLVLVKQT